MALAATGAEASMRSALVPLERCVAFVHHADALRGAQRWLIRRRGIKRAHAHLSLTPLFTARCAGEYSGDRVVGSAAALWRLVEVSTAATKKLEPSANRCVLSTLRMTEDGGFPSFPCTGCTPVAGLPRAAVTTTSSRACTLVARAAMAAACPLPARFS